MRRSRQQSSRSSRVCSFRRGEVSAAASSTRAVDRTARLCSRNCVEHRGGVARDRTMSRPDGTSRSHAARPGTCRAPCCHRGAGRPSLFGVFGKVRPEPPRPDPPPVVRFGRMLERPEERLADGQAEHPCEGPQGLRVVGPQQTKLPSAGRSASAFNTSCAESNPSTRSRARGGATDAARSLAVGASRPERRRR
jgi:hypothetical protein